LVTVAFHGAATLSLTDATVNEIAADVLMPRSYTLVRRAEQQAATRARILGAALDIYREQGFAAATTQAIAAAADVAPGTVRNHFPTPMDLAAAAGERILEDTGLPGLEIFEGHATVADRVALLARELGGFFERSASWWQVREGNPDLASAWVRAESRYDDHVARLAAAAIEPRGAGRATASVVVTIVGGPLYYRLRAAGLSEDETVAVELSLVLPWLEGQSG
jgi:AcrR family transcriptional regulator